MMIMAGGTRTAEPKQTAEVKPVFFTSANERDKVRQDQVENVKLPPGARVATLEECIAFCKPGSDSADDLYRNGPAWTKKIGLTTSGRQADGSYHYGGPGRVAVGCYFYSGDLRLDIDADFGFEVRARVAYVFDDQAQAGREAAAPVGDVVAVQRDKFDAGKVASVKAEPLLRAANLHDHADALKAVFGE